MAALKQIRATARLFLKLSVENGQVSEARVRDVLTWFEQKTPANAAAILREYQRLIEREINRSLARIEHAGPLPEGTSAAIAASLAKLYGRPVNATARENPALLAGVRISIGDDVFERSIASQLETLAAAAV